MKRPFATAQLTVDRQIEQRSVTEAPFPVQEEAHARINVPIFVLGQRPDVALPR